MEEREALVLGGELVGVVDAVVAGVAESCLVGGTKHGGFFSATDVALDLHLMAIRSRSRSRDGSRRRQREREKRRGL